MLRRIEPNTLLANVTGYLPLVQVRNDVLIRPLPVLIRLLPSASPACPSENPA